MPETIEARPGPVIADRGTLAAALGGFAIRLGRRLAGERWLTATVAVSALVLLALLARPLLTGRIPVLWDLGVFHLPLRDFYARCLKAGIPFDWMPSMHTGVFITGEGEHGPYHPLHLLLYRLLPLNVGFAAELALCYPLMLVGTFLFLRPHAGRAGALLGGLVYTFSANNLYHGNHPNFVVVLAHLPWLLFLLEQLAVSGGWRRWLSAAGVGLFTGSQILLGHPQALSFSLLAEGLYALFLIGATHRPVQAGMAWCAGKALGLAIGGVQLLATLSFLSTSNRGTYDPLLGAFAPWRLIQVIVPNLMVRHVPDWWDEPFYFGAVAVVLLLWWLPARRWAPAADQGARRLTWFAVALGVLAAWLATGHYGRLYLLQTRLPLVGQLRAPSRYTNLLAFAGAVLAGVAFGRLTPWVRARRKLPWYPLALPWAAAAIAVAAAIAFQIAYPPAQPHGLDHRFASGAAVMLAAAVFLTLAVRGRTLGLYGLVLLAALDLWQHTLQNNTWGQPLWKGTPTLAQFNASTDQPPEPHRGGILGFTGYPTRLLLQGERMINGYRGGIEPSKRLDYLHLAALRVAGAGWYREVWTKDTCQVAGLEPQGNFWYRVPDPLPRFRLVRRARASDKPAEDLLAIDVDTTALTDRPLDLDGGLPGTASCALEQPGRLCIEVQSSGRQLLVTSESHDPNWQVAVDGVPAEVLRINGDFLGCAVEPGQHTVEFHFRPACMHWGLRLSLVGLGMTLLLGCGALVSAIRPTRRPVNTL